ncbi:MFS transporter [bacterium]|nr:MAG: MFS transporter [bacterium]
MSLSRHLKLFKSFGFTSFLTTQFLSAFNDNVFRIVLSMIAVNMAGADGSSSKYVSMAGAVFILPFLLFSGYAGYLADVYNKRSVLIVTKSFEIVAVTWGLFALVSGRIELMFIGLFLMAAHSAFFSPAKYGILPEMLPKTELSGANGFLEMSTFLAIVLGTAFGSFVYSAWKGRPELIGVMMIIIAVIGSIFSFGITRVPPSGSQKPFKLNPWGEIASGVRLLFKNRILLLTVLCITYFWFLGTLLQMALLLLGKEVMGLSDFKMGIFITVLAIGIGAGSVIAGRLSGEKIELGLTPLGAIGMGVFSVLMSMTSYSYFLTASLLALIGFFSGFFIVPLNTLLQQKSGKEEKGRIIATNNFINTGGILAASAVLWVVRDKMGISADKIILLFGFSTLVFTIFLINMFPHFLIRFSLWLFTHTFYKVRIAGRENIPVRGGALLVANHMSFIDGLLVGACVHRFIRFMVYRRFCEVWALKWFMRLMYVIPIGDGNKRDALDAVKKAREEIKAGHVVCIFAEGMITRTGNIMPFKKGFEKVVEGLDVPIIPVHLDRVWGSVFSFKHGKFFWKLPELILRPITVSFGPHMKSHSTAGDVRHAVMEVASHAVAHRIGPKETLVGRFMQSAKKSFFSTCASDTSGKSYTYGAMLTAVALLAGRLKKVVAEEGFIGVMLPASSAGLCANAAVMLAGKAPVNLNFTSGKDAIESAVKQCGVKTILTSREFLLKAKFAEMPGMIFLEDIACGISAVKKALLWLACLAIPASLLMRMLQKGKSDSEDIATVIFTSGSTGKPKGVVLTHKNVLANIEGFSQVTHAAKGDLIMGVLPFFHSFGFTGTLWFPLISGTPVLYHPNPLDASAIGSAVRKNSATIIMGTPTFYSACARKCEKEDFKTLRFAVAGSEKLRESVRAGFMDKFDKEVYEGYGCTEVSPVVSVNVPDVTHKEVRQTGHKPGTVGHAIPGVVAKVVDADGNRLGANKAGLLMVKGHSVMAGYFDENTKKAVKHDRISDDGWYDTGDVASIDEDGFIKIVDRLARFSKIGGEMAPHLKIEEAVQEVIGVSGVCVVTAVPDEQKGERLVVFYTSKSHTPEEIWSALQRGSLPKLWIPKRESMYFIEQIPLNATGKVELRKLKEMAIEFGGSGKG